MIPLIRCFPVFAINERDWKLKLRSEKIENTLSYLDFLIQKKKQENKQWLFMQIKCKTSQTS